MCQDALQEIKGIGGREADPILAGLSHVPHQARALCPCPFRPHSWVSMPCQLPSSLPTSLYLPTHLHEACLQFLSGKAPRVSCQTPTAHKIPNARSTGTLQGFSYQCFSAVSPTPPSFKSSSVPTHRAVLHQLASCPSGPLCPLIPHRGFMLC